MSVQLSPQQLDGGSAFSKLADPRLLRELAYIDGRWTAAPSAASFVVSDPASRMQIARVASLGETEARLAVDAAERAFPAWRARPPQDRADLLDAWYRLILSSREDLALIMTLEQGKPMAEALGEIDYAASFVSWYAAEAKRLNVESVTSHLPDAEMFVRREPIGIAALFTPWNFPSAMLTRKAAAALAAGCTIVAHPSPYTPLSALALAELAERAGFPAGVLNIVTGDPGAISAVFCDDPRIRAVSFTGSTRIGRMIGARCAATVKRLILELGGHAPLIVCDDADLTRAVDIAMAAKFATSGQDCLAANRIFVQRKLYGAFCDAFAERIRCLKTGSGMDPSVDIGPLMHDASVAKARSQIEDALKRGARRIVGETRDDGSLFLAPTLLVDVPDDALVMREETFAPIAAVTLFDTDDEVIRRANATEYGLVAYVVTGSISRAMQFNRALDYGMVAINRVKITGAPVPFGGTKQSGLGREGSRHGIEAFTHLKYTCLDISSPGETRC